MAIKQTIPFNYDEIYSFVSQKFTDKGYDVQEGSNTMQLVTAMSYLTSMLNANTAVNINETLLTLARKRQTMLRDARVLGYEIAHRQSYQYDLALTLTNTTGSSVTKTITKYSSFTSGSNTYYYMGADTDYIIPAQVGASPGSLNITLRVKEGILKRYTNEPTLTVVTENVYNSHTQVWAAQHYVDVPFTNVEDNGIEMFLKYYDDNGVLHDNEQWVRSSQFMIDKDTVLNKEFVRLDDIDYKMPRLYFKLGDVGKDIRIGTIVQMNVLITNGINGAITVTPTIDSTVLSAFATLTGYTLAIQGAEEESIESIRNNAPLFYNSANRLVTRPDYIAFVGRQPAVRYCDVWDGNLEFPPIPGAIWFSFVPATSVRSIVDTSVAQNASLWTLENPFNQANWYMKDLEIQNIYTELNKFKIPTLRFIHRHPIYMDFEYQVKIARYTVKISKAELNTNIFNIINDYFRANGTDDTDPLSAETFNFEYFQSSLTKRIDTSLTDSTGVDLYLTTTIPLCDKNVLDSELLATDGIHYLQEIEFHLGVPFDGVFNQDRTIILSNIPDIDTLNFISDQHLYLDKAGITYDLLKEQAIIPIYLTAGAGVAQNPLTDTHIGDYAIINTTYQDIEITMFIKTTITLGGGGLDPATGYTEGLNRTDFAGNGVRINVVYHTPNILASRNTIPRLKRVEFI